MAENYKQVSGDFQTPATEKEQAEKTEIIVNEGVDALANMPTIKDVREIAINKVAKKIRILYDSYGDVNIAIYLNGKLNKIINTDEFEKEDDESTAFARPIEFVADFLVILQSGAIISIANEGYAIANCTNADVSGLNFYKKAEEMVETGDGTFAIIPLTDIDIEIN